MAPSNEHGFRVDIEKLADTKFRAVVPGKLFTNFGISMEEIQTPSDKSMQILNGLANQIVQTIYNNLKQENSPVADYGCQISGKIGPNFVVYEIDFHEESENEYYGEEEVVQALDEILGNSNNFGEFLNNLYNKYLEEKGEKPEDTECKNIVAVFHKINECLEFYQMFLSDKDTFSVDLIKGEDNYGLYIEADMENIKKILDYITEFNGEISHIAKSYLEERNMILVNNDRIGEFANIN